MKRKYGILFTVSLFAIAVDLPSQTIVVPPIGPRINDYSREIYRKNDGSFHSNSESPLKTGVWNDPPYYTNEEHQAFYQWSLPNSLIPEGSTLDSVELEATFQIASIGGILLSRIDPDISTIPIVDVWWLTKPPYVPINEGYGSYQFKRKYRLGVAADSILAWVQSGVDNRDRFGLAFWTNTHESMPIQSVKLTIWLRPMVVTIKQLFDDNHGTLLGRMGHWETDQFGPYFAYYSAPAAGLQFPLVVNTTETFQGDTIPRLNEVTFEYGKYNNWDALPDVRNYKSFTVLPQVPQHISRFKPVNSATLQSQLLDGGVPAGGMLFKDPWLRDSTGDKGILNRGMEAVFHSVSYSEFNLGTGSVYKGVFLNENPTWDQTKPNYSVGAPNPNTINGFESYFIKWSGSYATFQDSFSLETPVVFTHNSATAAARYKAHLGSSLANATGTNSQRKLVSDDGSLYYLGYESAGSIWMTRSMDAGSSWSAEGLVSDGIGASPSSVPSLTVSGGVADDPLTEFGELNIIYRKFIGPTVPFYDIYVRKSVDGVWEDATKVNTTSVSLAMDPHPVIGRHNTTRIKTGDTPQLLAVWEGGAFAQDPLKWTTSRFVKGSWQDWTVTEDIPLTTSTHRNPSLSSALDMGDEHPLFLTYDNGSDIIMRRFGNSPVWTDPETVPASHSVTSYASQVSADTRDPANPAVHVVWEAIAVDENPPPSTDAGGSWNSIIGEEHVVMYEGKINSEWQDAHEFRSGVQGVEFHRPTIASLSNGKRVWAWDDGSSAYKAVYDGAQWELTEVTESGAYPNLVQEGTNGPLSTVKFAGMGPGLLPHPLQISSETSLLRGERPASSFAVKQGRRVDAVRRSRNGGATAYMSLELSGLNLVMSNGQRVPLSFPNASDSLFYENDAWSKLSTLPVTLTNTVDSICLDGNVGTAALRDLIENGQPLRFRFDLVDVQSGDVLQQIGTQRSFDRDTTHFFHIGERLQGLNGRQVFIRPSITGLTRRLEDIMFTLVHVHSVCRDTGETPHLSRASSLTSETLPSRFWLHQNYPNPFNPTTEIRFDLPDAGNVSLVVYDVLGRQVADLVTGYQEAGYHSATWNASSVASGVYFARLNITNAEEKIAFSKINKLMLIR